LRTADAAERRDVGENGACTVGLFPGLELAVDDRGVDGTRRERVDADAAIAEFHRPTFAQQRQHLRHVEIHAAGVRGRFHTNSGLGVFASVMAGLGIAMGSTVMCGAEIETSALVPLLRGCKLEPLEVHAVLPAGARPSTKVRALVDYLAQELK
jgi:DNA-binding transcriptional LysR family regulator